MAPLAAKMPDNNRMQLTRSAPLQGRLAPPSQLIRVFGGQSARRTRPGIGSRGKVGVPMEDAWLRTLQCAPST